MKVTKLEAIQSIENALVVLKELRDIGYISKKEAETIVLLEFALQRLG